MELTDRFFLKIESVIGLVLEAKALSAVAEVSVIRIPPDDVVYSAVNSRPYHMLGL